MTARHLLEKRLRWLNYVCWTGLAFAQAGLLLGWAFDWSPLPVVIPGLVLMAFGMGPGYALFLRCPRCRADASSLLGPTHDSVSAPCCSRCRVSFDEELP